MSQYIFKTESGEERHFIDIDTAAKLLGVSRRTLFLYLKKLNLKPEEKKRIGLRVYLDEEVISRAWMLNRRNERYSAYPNNRGAKNLERKRELGII